MTVHPPAAAPDPRERADSARPAASVGSADSAASAGSADSAASAGSADSADAAVRYGRFDVEMLPLGRSGARALRGDGSVSRFLEGAELRALNACAAPRTLAEHAAECVRTLPPAVLRSLGEAGESPDVPAPEDAGRDPSEAVCAALRGFAAEGLLTAETRVSTWLEERLDAAAQAPPPPPIRSLCIPTRDRPETLARGLASWMENGARHGRETEVVILDDSESAEAQARNREVLRTLSLRHRRPAFRATRARRAEYARALAATAGVPEETARFALLGYPRFSSTYGATRNALLLDAAGALCLQVDDDTVCTVCRPPGTREALSLSPEVDPNEYWFADGFAGALKAVEVTDEDFLTLHERMLGSTPGQCAASGRSGPVQVGVPWDAGYLRSVSEPGARVAVTFGGIVGDCGGPGRHHWRLALRGASLERLVGGGEGFSARLHARQGVKCPTRASISTGPYCMAGNVGLDNRALLPPFVPGGIAEDALFGMMRATLFPSLVSGFIPRAVVHDPSPRRRDPMHPVPLTMYANGVLAMLVSRFAAVWPAGEGAVGLRGLGEYLRALGTLPPPTFAALVRKTVFTATAGAVGQIESLLAARPGAPGPWREAMEENRRETAALIAREDPSSPSDFAGSDAARRALFQLLLRGYGDVLVHWPALVAAAGEMRGRGVRLAEAV